MERRKFTREFKVEAVKLIKDRGVSYVQAAQDLGVHQSVLRNWVKAFADDPQQAFPGQGQMKPEQLEITRLKREVTKLKAERDILKKAAVDSTGERNGFGKLSAWSHEAKSFPWTGVELERDSIEIVLAVYGQIRALREVLAQQAVGVFIAPSLPRTLGVAEVDGHVGSDAESLVVSEFSAAIPGQGGHQSSGQMLHLPDEGAHNAVAIFALNMDEQYESGLALDQGGDMRILPAGEQITLPVSRYRAVLHFGRTLPYRYSVNDLPTWLPLRGRCFATAHHPLASQARYQFLFQDPACLDEQAFVDCLVGHPHRLIVEIFALEPAGYLLRRPIIIQLLGHHHL
jgi:transposase